MSEWGIVWATVMSLAVVAHAGPIEGVVRRSDTHATIPGALVSRQATEDRTIAGPDGQFTLTVPDGANLTIVAAAKGFYNGSVVAAAPSAGVIIVLEPVATTADNPSYPLMAPESCSLCHPQQFAQWHGSPMNHAGVNTWVDDLYSGQGTPGGMGGFVYTRDSIFAAENPNSECASCHQPERWIQSPFSALADPAAPPTDTVLHGVSCEVCHKIADVDLDKINFPGIFPVAVTFTRPDGPPYAAVQYGLLGDVNFHATGLMRASFQPQLAAEVCAACHQDASDPAGNHSYAGPISEPTYLEWIESPYADPQSPFFATCVDCHMPPSGDDTVCEILYPPLQRDPATIRSHRIEGTTPHFLENAADLQLSVARDGPILRVSADVTNTLTGHHLPTGVTVRNMILLIEAKAPGGTALLYTSAQIVDELGGVGDPDQGYYAGQPGKLFAKIIEDFDGNSPTFFTDAAGIVSDNRIPALQTDSSEYEFVLPGTGGKVEVRARLLYRRSFRALTDAKQWTHDGHGRLLADLQPPHFGHLMEAAVQTIATPPGDFEGDGYCDPVDFAALAECIAGPAGGVDEKSCVFFDFDGDGDVDLADVPRFYAAFAP